MVQERLLQAYAPGIVWGMAALTSACASPGDRAASAGAFDAGTASSSSTASGGAATTPNGDDGGTPGVASGDDDAAAGATELDDAGAPCTATFPPVTDFGAPGPFAVTKDDATTIASLGTADCTIYRPTTLGQGGVQHPVIIWGNGTGTPTELVYEWLFNQWASHGFIVAAANTPNAGTGQEMLACLDWVEGQDTLSGSPYETKVSIGRAGSSGHSQELSVFAGVQSTVPFGDVAWNRYCSPPHLAR